MFPPCLTFVRLLCLIMLQFKWSQLGLEVNTLLRWRKEEGGQFTPFLPLLYAERPARWEKKCKKLRTSLSSLYFFLNVEIFIELKGGKGHLKTHNFRPYKLASIQTKHSKPKSWPKAGGQSSGCYFSGAAWPMRHIAICLGGVSLSSGMGLAFVGFRD